MAKRRKQEEIEKEPVVETPPEAQPAEVAISEQIPQPPSVEELINATLYELPNLISRRDSLATIMTILATYVGNPEIPVLKVGCEVALSELELTQGWTASDIDLTCNNIMDALGDEFSEMQLEFADKTGAESTGADFEIFAKRFNEERTQQSEWAGNARMILQAVREISGELGIPNPDPGAQPLRPEKPKKFLQKIGDAAATVGDAAASGSKKIISPFVDFVSEAEEEIAPPSWLTDSVIDEESRDMKILGLVQARLKSEADVQLVWATLEKLKLDREILIEVLKRVATKAREQLKQSKEILSTVSVEFKGFETRLKAIQNLRQIVIAVHDFFFPQEAI